MPVLGADITDAPAPKKRSLDRRYELVRLCDYLLHHEGAHVMKNPPRHEHGQVALRVIARLFRRGYSYNQIRSAVDKFYARYSDYDGHPVYLFVSNDVLHSLFSEESLSVVDPVMQFMANGFVRGSLDLVWHEDEDDDIRRVIMVSGSELVYCYPDVVAAAILEWHDDIATLREQIRMISDLLRWHTTEDDVDVTGLVRRIDIRLPDELTNGRKTPSALRPPQLTIAEAVAQVTQNVKKEYVDV